MEAESLLPKGLDPGLVTVPMLEKLKNGTLNVTYHSNFHE